jgi:tetratricopeptide (TPR) repeat protein
MPPVKSPSARSQPVSTEAATRARRDGESRGRAVWWMALLVALTVVAYLPALRGGFLWDDDAHVTRPELQSWAGLVRIWFEFGATQQYYPLLHSAFWLEHRLWGDATWGYHLANVVEHALAACLLYAILRRLRVPAALLAAGIFAVHPVMVESVAWISEQKNTLSAVFYLGALLAYLRFDEQRSVEARGQSDRDETHQSDRRARIFYALSLVLFLMGLLTKTVTATLPAVLLVIFWWQRGALSWRRDVRPLVPWFVVGAVAGITTALVERYLIGAEGEAFELSVLERCLLAGRAIWFYIGKLLWPRDLIFSYPRWRLDPAQWWQWLFPLAALGVTGALWLLHRRSRGPLAGWLCFVGTLFPVLGFLNVYPFIFSYVADHFQYLASLGLIVTASAGLALAAQRLPERWRPAGSLAGGALVAVLACLTWQQCRSYSDVFTLYRATIERNPGSWFAYNNLGNHYSDAGQFKDAIENYRQALAVRPDYVKAHCNLGWALLKQGDAAAGKEELRTALAIEPKCAPAHAKLAAALVADGEIQGAIEHYYEAVKLRPENTGYRCELAEALMAEKRRGEAIDQLRAAIKLDPNQIVAHNDLGVALAMENDFEGAIEELRAALRVDPTYADAGFNLAKMYNATGRPEDAAKFARRALELARQRGEQDLAERIEAWVKRQSLNGADVKARSGGGNR